MKEYDLISEQEKLRIYKVTDLNKIKELKKKYKLPIEVRTKKLCERKGFKIYLVDGYKVRQFIDIDFTMGGHGLRYVYVPLNEIWIDSSNINETEHIITHEITEFNLMKKGIDYEIAHDYAGLSESKIFSKKIILPVGHFRQPSVWNCGPSSLKIVLDYYKDKIDIKTLIKETGCDETGTLHSGFKKTLKKQRYQFFEKEKISKIEDIENLLKKGIPIIVDYQAYRDGHFSVIIGRDEKRFLFSDPAYDKKFKWMNKKEFERRWYEEDEPGKIIKKWMLAVYPK